MGVDDAAVAVGPLVEIKNRIHAEVRQIVGEFFEMFAREDFLAISSVGTASHNGNRIAYSPFVRLLTVVIDSHPVLFPLPPGQAEAGRRVTRERVGLKSFAGAAGRVGRGLA